MMFYDDHYDDDGSQGQNHWVDDNDNDHDDHDKVDENDENDDGISGRRASRDQAHLVESLGGADSARGRGKVSHVMMIMLMMTMVMLMMTMMIMMMVMMTMVEVMMIMVMVEPIQLEDK